MSLTCFNWHCLKYTYKYFKLSWQLTWDRIPNCNFVHRELGEKWKSPWSRRKNKKDFVWDRLLRRFATPCCTTVRVTNRRGRRSETKSFWFFLRLRGLLHFSPHAFHSDVPTWRRPGNEVRQKLGQHLSIRGTSPVHGHTDVLWFCKMLHCSLLLSQGCVKVPLFWN